MLQKNEDEEEEFDMEGHKEKLNKPSWLEDFLEARGMSTTARRVKMTMAFVKDKTASIRKIAAMLRNDIGRKDALPIQGLMKILVG